MKVHTVQMRCWSQGNEELTPIRSGSAICHAKRPFGGMLEIWVDFVFELAAVNRRASTTCAGRLELMSASEHAEHRQKGHEASMTRDRLGIERSYIATLNHKARDDAMEDDIVVFACCGESREVATCLKVNTSVDLRSSSSRSLPWGFHRCRGQW